MTTETLVELIRNNSDLEPRRYSGRGMMGKECVGFEVEAGEEIGEIAALVREAAIQYDDETPDELVTLFRNCRTDQMGRDNIIVYFPSMEWPRVASAA